MLTYAWHSWPLSSKGSLACDTYCDTGHHDHLPGLVPLTPIALRLPMELSTCFYDLGLSRLRFEYPTFRLRADSSNPSPRSLLYLVFLVYYRALVLSYRARFLFYLA